MFNQNLEAILTSIKNRVVKLVVVYLYNEMPWDIENEQQPFTMNVTNSVEQRHCKVINLQLK